MSMQVFQDSVFFGVFLSLSAYALGLLLKRKTGWSLMNPLLISIVLVIGVLLLTGVSYEKYSAGASLVSYLLTPATVCLAVPLYQPSRSSEDISPLLSIVIHAVSQSLMSR